MRTLADDKLVAERQQFPLGLNIWYFIQVVGVDVMMMMMIRY